MKSSAINRREVLRGLAIASAAMAMPACAADGTTAVHGYRIVATYPHDANAYTQGLIYLDGVLYESTGLNGRSSLRKVKFETGEVLQQVELSNTYFAEGLTAWGDELIQLTYLNKMGFVYDRASLKLKRSFPYSGQGWGLTHDRERLIMSDGSAELRFWDPKTLTEITRLPVRDRGRPVSNLNELEYVRGEILANIWHTDRIARISPTSGDVTSWIDLSGLRPADAASAEAVLNGIAYDAAKNRLFVTGKLWSKLYEIEIV